ncbi:MAG: rhodanese-like domain-containing protein [Defluviitaleaceae bacterium]|nr:rhodanese-like domain-containing protein [Defluviitaleaceae bacterium]
MKKFLLAAGVLALAIMVVACGEEPQNQDLVTVPPTTNGGEVAPPVTGETPEQVAPVTASSDIFITVDELRNVINDVVLVGVIDPTMGLVPFTNASNPIHGSYLVWTPDYMRGGTDEAISPEVAIFRRPADEMEELLSRAGITPDSKIVVYHSDSGAQSARVYWHLYALGFNVRFLDGGNAAWRAANGRTGGSSRMNRGDAGNLTVPNRDFSNHDAGIEGVLHALQNPDEWVVIDVRNDAERAGERVGASSNAFGTGRIAGTYHIEWTNTVDSDGFIRPEAELRELFAFIGDRSVITYCQGGVRSAHLWMVLKSLGFNVYNYDGSWIEWSYAASSAGSFHDRDLVLSFTEEWTDNNGRI